MRSTWQLWPTKVEFFQHGDVHHNKDLIDLALAAAADRQIAFGDEVRAYDFHQIDHPAVRWLIDEFKIAAQLYLTTGTVRELTIRAVVMGKGSHINTHTEVRESDLMLVYWPGGDVGKEINSRPDPTRAPAFMLEDPSRHLTDLRLPEEVRHSIMVCPQPGLLTVAPAHLPHNLHPYMGDTPFIHIVAQARIDWPQGYELRW